MTLSVLALRPGQKIARPFCRACSADEMAQLIPGFGTKINASNIDSDEPVVTRKIDGEVVKFFAFTEE